MRNSEGPTFRMLYCSVALTFGGEQKQMMKILSHLDREHFQPIICCIRQFGYVEQTIRNLASKFICLQVRSRYNLLGEIWRLRRVIKEHDIDLIHTGIFGSEFSPLLAAMSAQVPAIAFLTTTYDLGPRFTATGAKSAISYWKTRVFYMVHAVLARMVKVQYIAYSQAIKESAIRNLHLPPGRIAIMPLGLNPDEFDGRRLDQEATVRVKAELGLNGAYPILLNVARVSPVKGQKDLLEVMPRILEHFPGARLLIAGDGDAPLLSELTKLRDHMGLQGHVHLLGRRDDIVALLHASDVFVFSSYYEGLPGAVVEAMAAGKPVVAFDIPALKEVVKNEYSGVLVEGRNVRQFAEAIIRLVKHPGTAREMGERGRQIVREQFDIRRNAKELEATYERMLAGRSVATAKE